MKITFENKDKNYTFSSGSNLLYLAQQNWSGFFERENLSVFFVTEDEMKKNETPENLEDLNSPDYLGLYFSCHDEYGCDVIFICPERIKNTSENRKIDFDLLLSNVFVHELAHSLMQQNVFSVSEIALYKIPSFKFFEESLCNAFSLLHFSGSERDSLTDFCKAQSPGYRHFFIWDEGALLASMNQFKLFKDKNHFLFNYLWIEKNIDALLDDASEVLNKNHGNETFRFEHVNIVGGDKRLSSEVKNTKEMINNLLKIKNIISLSFLVIKESRDVILELVKRIGFSVEASGDVFLLYKNESLLVRFFCLNKNDFSIFVVDRKLFDNLVDYPFHCLIPSSKPVVENSKSKIHGGQKRVFTSKLKVGMTMIEVLEIVGENNLAEAAEFLKPAFPYSDKIMTFKSGGVPSGCVLGFKNEVVDRIRQFSLND